jgi:hypothetical protein
LHVIWHAPPLHVRVCTLFDAHGSQVVAPQPKFGSSTFTHALPHVFSSAAQPASPASTGGPIAPSGAASGRTMPSVPGTMPASKSSGSPASRPSTPAQPPMGRPTKRAKKTAALRCTIEKIT